ncbi:MAG TPA: S8 family serine peptidase, partial [Actinomycetota bacterium]|nr:S8 family serine peptidase [Actinomycetota bacterium]
MLRARSISLATLVVLLLVASLGAGSAAAAPQRPAPEIQGEYAEGQLIVGFEESLPREGRNGAHRALGASVEKSLGRTNADLVKLPHGKSVEAAIEEYSNQPGVIYAEPDYILRTDGVTANDPRYVDQWALRNTGQTFGGTAGTADADIDASESGGTADAWSLTTGSSDVIVAVIDSGIDFGHPDLGPNKWVNTGEVAGNGVDDDRNGLIDDLNGWDFAHGDSSVYDVAEVCPNQTTVHNDDHGTHVAGIVAARGNNGIGISGIAWNVKLMSLKFLEITGGQCGGGRTSKSVEAINYAIAKGADVINASWGGTANSPTLQTALNQAIAAGIVVATAAGNSNLNLATSPDYPSSFNLPGQIVVAASNRFDQKASVSN